VLLTCPVVECSAGGLPEPRESLLGSQGAGLACMGSSSPPDCSWPPCSRLSSSGAI
jgi:hypothetical protein